MNSLPMQYSQMGRLPPIQGMVMHSSSHGMVAPSQGIPKHLSPEQAASAPHSQEAVHPYGDAKTDEVIECVVRGETRLTSTQHSHSINDKFAMELSRFNEIFSWYSSGRDPNSKNAPKPKNGRKRTATSNELEPELKKFISHVVESDEVVKQTDTTNAKESGANPLKKMEMMTKSPAFEITSMNQLTDNRKECREVDENGPSTSTPSSLPPTTFPSLSSSYQPPPYMSHHQYPMQQMLPNGLPPHGFPSPSFASPNHPQVYHNPYQQYPRPAPFPYPS